MGMREGVHVRLSYWDEKQNRLDLPDLIIRLTNFTEEIQYYPEYMASEGIKITNIVMKSLWSERIEKIKRQIFMGDLAPRVVSLEQFEACSEYGCFEKVIASQYPLFSQEGFYLHDRHGEDYHAVHQYCPRHHIKPSH